MEKVHFKMSLLVCWGNGGRVNSAWGSKWGLLCGTSGRRKLRMVPCHNFHIYGIWWSKKVGKALKSSFGVAMQAIRRDNFYWKKRGSYYVILLYWNFTVSLTGYCKLFYGILPLFPILLLFYLFCIYWGWQGQKCYLKCPKVYEINTEL